MQLGDLTNIANVKAWMAANSFASGNQDALDSLIFHVIPRVSQSILAYLEREWILPRSYTETYDPTGGRGVILRNWPVLAVDSVSFYGQVIQPSVGGRPPGYSFDPWNGIPPGRHQILHMLGGRFGAGARGLSVAYTAGYQVTDEPATVPPLVQPIPPPTSPLTTSLIALLQPYGMWAQDVSVRYALTDVLLTRVYETPTVAGTYFVVDPDTQPGVYEFFTDTGGDADAELLITYGFVPSVLEGCAAEWVVERLVSRQHIGEISRAINQQTTVKYDVGPIPAYIKGNLWRFRNALPI